MRYAYYLIRWLVLLFDGLPSGSLLKLLPSLLSAQGEGPSGQSLLLSRLVGETDDPGASAASASAPKRGSAQEEGSMVSQETRGSVRTPEQLQFMHSSEFSPKPASARTC